MSFPRHAIRASVRRRSVWRMGWPWPAERFHAVPCRWSPRSRQCVEIGRSLSADLDRATVRASENGIALIDELIRNRVTRALEVERPLIGALSPRQQEDAIAAVPGVLGQIEALHAHSNAAFADSSMLDARQAVTLSRLGARLPPVAAAAVILHSRGALLRGDSTVSPAMARFVLGATNEETLVAAYAYSGDGARRRSPVVSPIMVSVAAALPPLPQRPVS